MLCVLACIGVTAAANAGSVAESRAAADVAAQVDAGQFAAGNAAIEQALAANPSREIRSALEFQRERMRRILLDFTLSEDEVKAKLREQIPDLNDAEFDAWKAAGLFETQVIDGRSHEPDAAPADASPTDASPATGETEGQACAQVIEFTGVHTVQTGRTALSPVSS